MRKFAYLQLWIVLEHTHDRPTGLTQLFNPLPNDKILDSSKLKQFADDSFKFDENSRKFSKCVENTVGKGEIARYEQFLLFPQCSQKACFARASKGVIVWEWVNRQQNFSLFQRTIVGKGEKVKMLVTKFSPILTMFSNAFFFRGCQKS